MRVLGFHLLKGELRWTLLSGTREAPVMVCRGRLQTSDPDKVPELMDWYDSQFEMLLEQHKPDRLAYRLTLGPKKAQLFSSEFPLGLLNLQAHRRRLPIECYTSKAFVARRLGLPKGTELYARCDAVFGNNPPYWDKNQKNSLLVAWFELEP